MHNEHSTSHDAPGFGKNTNGLGIFIISLAFVAIALFTWCISNNNQREYKFYRLESKGGSGQHEGGNHGGGHNAHG